MGFFELWDRDMVIRDHNALPLYHEGKVRLVLLGSERVSAILMELLADRKISQPGHLSEN